jgi:glycosyltransferase involved in cell wall biosynthesis
MRILTYDPMLKNAYGHHLPVTKFIHEQALRRGFESIVFVNRDLPAHATRLPFRRECKSESYTWFTDDEALKGILLYTRENAVIQQDLCRLLPPAFLREGDVVVMHTFVIEHLLGILDWFERVDKPISLRLFTYFPPWRAGFLGRELAEPLALYSLRRWAKCGKNVKFFTENEDLSELMSSFSAVPFTSIHPPVDFCGTKPAPRRVRSDGGFTWVYPGEGRWEKGLRFLPDAWRMHHERFPADTLKVQYIGVDKGWLDKLGGVENGVRSIPRALHGQEYFAHLASGDFVLFPYEPSEYLYRASHLLLETLSMARPVVVSSGTWLEKEVHAYPEPVGSVMREWNADGLALAMAEARRNAEALQNAAELAAPLVRERYEHSKFFDEFVLS